MSFGFNNFGFADGPADNKAGKGVKIYRNDKDKKNITARLRRLFERHGITIVEEGADFFIVDFPEDWTKDTIMSMITETSYKNGKGKFIFSSVTQFGINHWTHFPTPKTKKQGK